MGSAPHGRHTGVSPGSHRCLTGVWGGIQHLALKLGDRASQSCCLSASVASWSRLRRPARQPMTMGCMDSGSFAGALVAIHQGCGPHPAHVAWASDGTDFHGAGLRPAQTGIHPRLPIPVLPRTGKPAVTGPGSFAGPRREGLADWFPAPPARP